MRIALFVIGMTVAFSLGLALTCADAYGANAAAVNLKTTTPVKVSTTAIATNAKGRANSAVIFRYGLVGLKRYRDAEATASSYDVTGDAQPDTVAISVAPRADTGLFDVLTIKVNDAQAYALNAPKAGFDQASARIVTLRNNKPFLYVSAYAADGSASQALLGYSSGKLVKVVGNDLLKREGASDAHISSIRPSANRIIVEFDFVSTMTGLSRTSFTYTWKAGGLVRKSNTTSALRFATKSTGGYTKQARKTSRALVAFADSPLKKKAFTIPAGKSVRPLGLCLTKTGLAYKLRFGKKTGWVKCPSAAECKNSPVLTGTYGCIPLISKTPAYTSKAIGLATLQRYGNHALYIARNEVYARHGRAYATDELRALFSAESWYESSSDEESLSDAEMKNVLLMRAIEKHRRSPYA